MLPSLSLSPALALAAVTSAAALAATLPAGAPPKGEQYAFLVACQDYDQKELHPLRYTRADVTAFAEALKESGYRQDHVTLLHDERGVRHLPTAANIREKLRLVIEAADEEDSVVVALSGHGIQFEGEQAAYFCPIDARLEDRKTLIPLDEVYQALERCKAGRKLLLVDACRDEPQSKISKAANRVRVESRTRPPAREATPKGIMALFSCDAGQQSYEYPDLGHGIFFHQVIDGWKGKAAEPGKPVTLDSLRRYVRAETKTFAREKLDALQTPVERGEFSGADEWVLNPRVEPARPALLDCTGPAGTSKAQVQAAQQAWAKYLGRPVEETVTVNGVPITFVLVPPGKFLMGSPREEQDYLTKTCFDGKRPNWLDKEAQHEVTLTQPFDLMKTELTQAQYRALTGESPSNFQGDDLPVEQVTWTEADEFARKLTGKLADRHLYRLPTEAEWEYSCRGGASASKPFGIGDGTSLSSTQANFDGEYTYGGAAQGEYRRKTVRVGSYPANALGLADLHGNVDEWCSDWYGDYPSGQVTDPSGPLTGSDRVLRGGGWYCYGQYCRSAYRRRHSPDYRLNDLGFRLARSVPSAGR